MNKKLIVVAVAGALALPMAANAGGKVKTYGAMHVAVERISVGDGDAQLSMNSSSRKGNRLGIKGSKDTNVADFKAVFQFEAGLNMEDTHAKTGINSGKPTTGLYFQRDSWVGLSSKSMGTVRAGTMATSYKQSGAKLDPLFTTGAEGRGAINIMSATMHAGVGDGRGRSAHTVRYDSPSIAGAKVIVDYNIVAGGAGDNFGAGVHWKNGPAKAFFDYQSIHADTFGTGDDVNAMKFGGAYTVAGFTIGAQYEIDGGAISKNKDGTQNMLFVTASYKMGSTTFIVNGGMADEKTDGAKNDNTSYVVAVSQAVAKKTGIYVGYAGTSGGDKHNEVSALIAGMTAKF